MTTRLIAPMPLTDFLNLIPFNPYVNPPWPNCAPLDPAEVQGCLDPNPGRRDWSCGGEATSTHTARIAHLARTWPNDGSDPIEVEVFDGVIVNDGWHRIAAAIARGDRLLYVEVSGVINEAVEYGFPVGHVLSDAINTKEARP